jgi:succinate dehydrogenase/fumarate reductase-like Fe-S protein
MAVVAPIRSPEPAPRRARTPARGGGAQRVARSCTKLSNEGTSTCPGLLLECNDVAELSCGGPPRDLGSEAVTFVLGLTHREVERDLVVDVAGAAAGTQQRQQPIPPTDRVMDALHDRMITRAASRA